MWTTRENQLQSDPWSPCQIGEGVRSLEVVRPWQCGMPGIGGVEEEVCVASMTAMGASHKQSSRARLLSRAVPLDLLQAAPSVDDGDNGLTRNSHRRWRDQGGVGRAGVVPPDRDLVPRSRQGTQRLEPSHPPLASHPTDISPSVRNWSTPK